MHISVLLKEVIYYLNPKPGDTILDATINGGGHARVILDAIGEKGKLIGIEQDTEIFENLEKKFGALHDNVILINGNFRNLDESLSVNNIEKLDGAMFDLGFSSLQLDGSGRGLSFQKDEPLLMTLRSDTGSSDLTAKDIVNEWGEKDISNVLFGYGEEKYSKRIAKGIVEARAEKQIETTFDLVEIIRESVPAVYKNNRRTNCCTKTFQALRIAVNDELAAAEEGIEKAWNLLGSGGRLVVISFHSLEDRIVKQFFKKLSNEGIGEILTKKPITPSDEEKQENPRARSAKLRAIIKP